MAKVEKEKGKEEKGSGHYSSHFPFFINTLLNKDTTKKWNTEE